MKISVFIPGQPPRTTAQEKKIGLAGGRPVVYEPKKVKDARCYLTAGLLPHRPSKPLDGAVGLDVEWRFGSKSHRDGEYKVTRPDTDNLEKLLKDCMTHCGYWKDDAQVAVEHVTKIWADNPGIYIEVEEI